MRTLLERVLELWPSDFRLRFGDEMVEHALEECRRARSRGRVVGLWVAVTTVMDLAWLGLVERVRPTWVQPRQKSDTGRGVGMMISHWIRDLGHAARSLWKSPGFTLAAVGTLALALGANAGIYSVVQQVLLDPLPYENSDRLVAIAASAPGSDFPEEFPVAAEFFIQYSEEADLLEDLAYFNDFTATLRVGDRAERLRMSMPSLSLFSTLGAEPVLGRLPRPEEEDDVAVISHGLWTTWFGNDPGVIGQSYEMVNGEARTIVGVMGPEFGFPSDETVLWVPNQIQGEIQPGRFGMSLVGRMTPEATHGTLRDQLDVLAARLPERFGGSPAYARLIEQHVPVVRSLEESLLGSIAGALWVLMGAVVVVLLIACANVANLFAVRAEGRGRDLAVRRAIGAGRAQLIRAQLAESLVIAAFAGALAVPLAAVTLPSFLAASPEAVPRIGSVGISSATIGFTLLASVVAAILCGIVPAVKASMPDLNRLRDGARGSTQRRHWGRDSLVVGQTALALVLLVGSALLLRSFYELRSVDPGYDAENVFTFQFAPDEAHLVDGPSWAAFHMDFMDQLRALPGVESVGIVENVPLDEGLRGIGLLPEGATDEADDGPRANMTFAGGDYFEAMAISVLRGRAFTPEDIAVPGSIVISESVAEMLWPGQDPLGRTLTTSMVDVPHTIVGVVEDIVQYDFRDDATPLVYYPLVGPGERDWALSSPGYVVKTERAETIAPEIRELVRKVAPTAPMYRTYTMESLVDRSMVQLSFTMLTLAIASGLALLLAAIGLYGVLSYVVAQRTQEIGVRMALGAQATRVRRMVVGQGARVVGLGVVLGLGVTLVATRALGSLLFGVAANDPVTISVVAATMVAVGALASYLPARRASQVDPIESMRAG
jgi:predicted permease